MVSTVTKFLFREQNTDGGFCKTSAHIPSHPEIIEFTVSSLDTDKIYNFTFIWKTNKLAL